MCFDYFSASTDSDVPDRPRHVSSKIRHQSSNLRERLGTGDRGLRDRLGTGDRKMSVTSSSTGDASDVMKQVWNEGFLFHLNSRKLHERTEYHTQ